VSILYYRGTEPSDSSRRQPSKSRMPWAFNRTEEGAGGAVIWFRVITPPFIDRVRIDEKNCRSFCHSLLRYRPISLVASRQPLSW
jgi:hypothetical protein